jgi:type II secretory pathway pseudopilin PulG
MIPKRTQLRAGTTLVEIVATTVLLASATVFAAELLLRASESRRLAREQQTARQEVANVLERLTAEPWEKLTPERAAAIEISPAALQAVPTGALAVEIAPAAGDASARRIVARFTWRDRRGQPRPTVQLAAWVYRPGGSP